MVNRRNCFCCIRPPSNFRQYTLSSRIKENYVHQPILLVIPRLSLNSTTQVKIKHLFKLLNGTSRMTSETGHCSKSEFADFNFSSRYREFKRQKFWSNETIRIYSCSNGLGKTAELQFMPRWQNCFTNSSDRFVFAKLRFAFR